MINLNKYKYKLLGKWPQRYKAFILSAKENKELKTRLEKDGFFNLFSLNNGYIAYYHQIVAFYNQGVHILKRGYYCPSNIYEVHHINGNSLDNRKNNLIIIPKDLHKELSKSQRRLCKYVSVFSKSSIYNLNNKLLSIPCFNSKGNLVYNKIAYFVSILLKTLYNSWLFFKPCNVDFNLNNIKKWILKTKKNLMSFIPIGNDIQMILPLNN